MSFFKSVNRAAKTVEKTLKGNGKLGKYTRWMPANAGVHLTSKALHKIGLTRSRLLQSSGNSAVSVSAGQGFTNVGSTGFRRYTA